MCPFTRTTDPRITHPEKVFFPDHGITRAELAAYYEEIAPVMVPHFSWRPSRWSVIRTASAEKGFFHKDVSKGFPAWLERVEVPKKEARSTIRWSAICGRSSGWPIRTASRRTYGSRVLRSSTSRTSVSSISIPSKKMSLDTLGTAPLGLRALLDELVSRAGSRPPARRGSTSSSRSTARRTWEGREVCARRRDDTRRARHEASHTRIQQGDRRGRIYVDTGRNGYSATFAAPYAVRAKPGAPVSAPCSWEEIERGEVGPRTFTLRTMAKRVEDVGDLWADMPKRKRSLRRAIERLRRLVEKPK